MPEFLTPREVAAIRRRSPQALTMERQRGNGPPYIVDGGRILYPEAELYEWLEARRVEPEQGSRSES
jgi:hypothetical protein